MKSDEFFSLQICNVLTFFFRILLLLLLLTLGYIFPVSECIVWGCLVGCLVGVWGVSEGCLGVSEGCG